MLGLFLPNRFQKLESARGAGEKRSVNPVQKDAVTSLTSCITFSFSTGTSSNVFTLSGRFSLLLLKAREWRGQHETWADAAPVSSSVNTPAQPSFLFSSLVTKEQCPHTFGCPAPLQQPYWERTPNRAHLCEIFLPSHPWIHFPYPVSTALQRLTQLFKFSSTGQVLGLDSPSGHKVMFSGI